MSKHRSRHRADAVSNTAERRASRPAQIDESQAYGIPEVCSALDISRPQFYRLKAQGRIHLIEPALDSRPRVSGREIMRILGLRPIAAA